MVERPALLKTRFSQAAGGWIRNLASQSVVLVQSEAECSEAKVKLVSCVCIAVLWGVEKKKDCSFLEDGHERDTGTRGGRAKSRMSLTDQLGLPVLLGVL